MQYIALIGDIIDSKQLENRFEAQKQLSESLKRINDKYRSSIVSKFTITLGDEFQALLTTEAPIFHLIDDICLDLKPVKVRFGIGVGDILTEINPEQSIGSDGPAYWNARDAIKFIHQNNDYGNTQIAVQLKDENLTEDINTLLAAGDAIKANWRASQESVFDTLLNMDVYDDSFDHQKLGQKLDLNASALSKRLKSTSLKVYFRSRKTALKWLRLIVEEEKNV